jgi:hypothetical protein
MSGRSSVWSPRFWLRSRPLGVGLGLALVTVVVSELLRPPLAADLHAMVLVFVAAPYAGFASFDGRTRAVVTEVVGIAAFCALALLGLWVWHPIWILGYAGHAVWDTLHHPESGFGATIVGWYVPFCAVYDALVAGYLAVVYLG